MNSPQKWIAKFVAISIYFLATITAAQATAVKSSCIWPHEGTIYDEKGKQIIQADEIGECITAGKDVIVKNAVIKGILDLSKLPLEITESLEDDPHAKAIYVKGVLSFTNSSFEIASNSNIRNVQEYERGITPIIFEQEVSFSCSVDDLDDEDNTADCSTFEREVSFVGVTFRDIVTFNCNPINGEGRYRGCEIFAQPTKFNSVTFEKEVRFDGPMRDVKFSNTIFKSEASFTDVIDAGFYNVDFYSNAHFTCDDYFPESCEIDIYSSGTTFFADADFSNRTFGEATFDYTTFKGIADFSDSDFHLADFYCESLFGGCTTFEKQVDFSGTNFHKQADFSGVNFFAEANFAKTIFPIDKVSFSETIFSKPPTFFDTTFSGDVDLLGMEFSGRVSFSCEVSDGKCTTFNGDTNFAGVTFSEDIDFSGNIFLGNTDFSNAVFQSVDFTETDFRGEARFNSAKITGTGCFFDTRFRDLVSFWQLQAAGMKTVFTSSRFDKKVIFDKTEINEIDFSSTGTCDDAELGTDDKPSTPPAAFFDQVNFRNAKVGKANFQEALFTDLNLSGSTFTDSLNLSDTLYNKLFYTGSQEEFFPALRNTFPDSPTSNELKQNVTLLRQLEVNFKGFRQLDLANEAYYQRKILERRYILQNDGENGPARRRNPLTEFGDWLFFDMFSGYLVRWWHPAITSIFLISFFAFLYFTLDAGHVLKKGSTENEESFLKAIRTGGEFEDIAFGMLWIAFRLSFSVFLKLNVGRLRAHHPQIQSFIHGLVIAEWLIGAIMIATLTVSIANSVPGLERIVGAILPG